MTLRAGIIGAGRIAWQYDSGVHIEQQPSVTLASCLHRHPETLLVSVFDPVAESRKNFHQGYLGPQPIELHEDLNHFLAQKLDLVAIASPSQYHADHIEACLNAAIPRLWIEKPVTLKLEDYGRLLKQYQSLIAVPRICVNYLRRSLPQITYMKDFLAKSPDIPATTAINLTYSRQLEVNGIHLLDLLGALTDSTEAPPLDFIRTGNGENPQFGLTVTGYPVTVTGHDLPYHLIEISITDSRGRLSLVHGAQELVWEAAEPNPDYPGFFRCARPRPVPEMSASTNGLQEATYNMLCALLDDRKPSPSSLETAWFSQSLLDRVQTACLAGA
ncbi:MAG: Gfo/Idh/MocA family protein [Granulosicoccus sp.]